MRFLIPKQLFRLEKLIEGGQITRQEVFEGCCFLVNQDSLHRKRCGMPIVWGMIGPSPEYPIYLYCVKHLIEVMSNPKASALRDSSDRLTSF